MTPGLCSRKKVLTSFSSATADQVVLNGGSVLEGVVLERAVTATAESAERPLRLLTHGGDELRLSGRDVQYGYVVLKKAASGVLEDAGPVLRFGPEGTVRIP